MPSSGYFWSGTHLRRIRRIACLTRDTHKLRKSCTGTDKYSLEAFFFHQLIDGNGFADDNVGLDLNAERFYILYLRCNNFGLRKTELRNTVNQNAACFMQCLKNSYIIAQLCKVSGTGKTGRTGTDDCYLLVRSSSAGAAGLMPFSLAQSATKRSSLPMETGSPLIPRIHFPSHWLSCGHTRPQTAGSAEDSLMTLICFFKVAFFYFMR